MRTPKTDLARRSWASLTLAVALAALAPSAAAQRLQPTLCAVADAAGQPVAGATVTLLGSQPHLSPSLRGPHIVKVETDARGRALARLRPGLCYVAWARTATAAGRRSYAPTVGYVSAGAALELRCGEPQAIERATVSGADAWRDDGPLRCFAMSQSPGAEVELSLEDDGSFELPGAPYSIFEARLPSGQPLWSAAMDRALRIPPPQRVRVRAQDGAGQPLAGAVVTHIVSHTLFRSMDGLRAVDPERHRTLGVTDAQGRCEVMVPYDGDPLKAPEGWLMLAVAASGRPPVFGGAWWRQVAVNNRPVAEFVGEELPFVCEAMEPLRGFARGAPAGTVAHLSVVDKRYISRAGFYSSHALTTTAEVRADGTFSFAEVPGSVDSCRLSLVPPPDSRWRPLLFAPEEGRQLPAVVRDADDGQAAAAGRDLELQVLDPNGLPARGAVALLSPVDSDHGRTLDVPMRVPLDQRGAASARVLPGTWLVSVFTSGGFSYQVVDVGVGGGRAQLQLAPLARTSVTLLDADGAPVAGVRVRPRGSSTNAPGDAVRSLLQRLFFILNGASWRALRTDADGRVEVPYASIQGVRRLVYFVWDDKRSDPVALVPDEAVTAREEQR